MSFTELLLRLCKFSLWCQENPWCHAKVLNVNNGGSYELDYVCRMVVEALGTSGSNAGIGRLLPNSRYRQTAGQARRWRCRGELSEGVYA
jgi:hypothetical protein